jgi:putative membrane protein
MKMSKLKNVLVLIPATILASPAFAQTGPMRDEYYGHMWGGGYGAGFLGFGMMILFWGGLIFLAVLAVRWFSNGGGGSTASSGQSAIDALKNRLAKGEIEIEDYEARRRALED